MINIKRLGSALLSSPTDIPRIFRCGRCCCKFEANGSDVQYDDNIGWYSGKCPCCGATVHEWNRE